MHSPRMTPALLLAVVFMMAACNNQNQNKGNETDTTKTTSTEAGTTTATTPASTIVNTPQNMLVILQKVANYTKWKMVYDSRDSARMAAGVHPYVIGRGLQDSNMVQVTLKVDDTAKAIAFMKDPGLKAAMQKGGIIGAPRMSLVTVTFQDTATIPSKLRSSVMLTVKDWDSWLKSFQAGNQQRIDNGITVRAYGYDAKDKNKVRVVTALVDSARAVAYFKSDTLKKRMATSGVVGQPNRFLYRIVQRY
jgi:hypothetical protein